MGKKKFPAGLYLYVGSAFAPGGLERIERHRDVSMGRNDTRMWHIDYLNEASNWRTVWCYRGDIECRLAEKLSESFEDAIEGFGCSDCGCNTHLFHSNDFNDVRREMRSLEDIN